MLLQPCVSFQTHTFDVPSPLPRGVGSPLSHPPDSQPHTPPFLAEGQQVVGGSSSWASTSTITSPTDQCELESETIAASGA